MSTPKRAGEPVEMYLFTSSLLGDITRESIRPPTEFIETYNGMFQVKRPDGSVQEMYASPELALRSVQRDITRLKRLVASLGKRVGQKLDELNQGGTS